MNTRRGPLGPHCKKKMDPQIPPCRRRFQTGETPEKLEHMSRLLGPFRHRHDERIKKKKNLCLSLSGARDWWSGRRDAKFEEPFSTRRDGQRAGLASVTTNNDGNWRTTYRRRYDVQLEQGRHPPPWRL